MLEPIIEIFGMAWTISIADIGIVNLAPRVYLPNCAGSGIHSVHI